MNMSHIVGFVFAGLLMASPVYARDTPRGVSPMANIYVAEWSKLRHSADQGDVSSQFLLANFYYEPPEKSSLPQSYGKAAKYYRMAAQQNHGPSQHNLAVLLVKGQGVERDWPEAYAWFSLAADQGFRAAREAMESLKLRMNEAELARADALRTKFKAEIR